MSTKYSRTNQFSDGDFTVPAKTGPERITYPFGDEGDYATWMIEQDYIVYSDYYTPASIGEVHSDYSDAYFIKDSPPNQFHGAVCTYTRTWATIPGLQVGKNLQSAIRKEYTSYVWTRPGFTTDDTTFRIYFIDTSKLTYGNGLAYLYAANGETHNLTEDKYKYAQVNYSVFDPISGQEQNRTTIREIVSRGSDWVAVPIVVDGIGGYVLYRWFGKPQLNRNPKQVVVPAVDLIDYWVPGVNCDSPEDIEIIQQWEIIDTLGNATEYLSETSHPPLWDNESTDETGYYTMVKNKELIAVESSIVRRWQFGGDVYERRTKYINIV